MAKTRHRISGVIEIDTPQHIIDHPVLGKYLEVVEEKDKALEPALISRDDSKAVEIAARSKQAKSEGKDN